MTEIFLPAWAKQRVYIVDWDFIHQYLPLYQKAAVLTLQIGALGILASIAIGILCTMIHYFKVPFARQVVSVYVEISRNTPLLIQLFFIYYGLPKIGIRTNPYACGVAGLAFLGGNRTALFYRCKNTSILLLVFFSAFYIIIVKRPGGGNNEKSIGNPTYTHHAAFSDSLWKQYRPGVRQYQIRPEERRCCRQL